MPNLINHSKTEEPIITVCLPTKNMKHCIQEVLKAIEILEYSKRIKLVFVDDYSADRTSEILTNWKTRMKKQYYDIILIQKRTNILT